MMLYYPIFLQINANRNVASSSSLIESILKICIYRLQNVYIITWY